MTCPIHPAVTTAIPEPTRVYTLDCDMTGQRLSRRA